MSSTRRAPDNAPLSQERYMSSPEYAALRGLSGTAVTAKAAYLVHPRKRSLLLFLQAMSLEPGRLGAVVKAVLEGWAGHLGSPTMHKIGTAATRVYNAEQVRAIRAEIGGVFPLRGEVNHAAIPPHPDEARILKEVLRYEPRLFCDILQPNPDYTEALERHKRGLAKAQEAAAHYPKSYPASELVSHCRKLAEKNLERFLFELCINPEVEIPIDGEATGAVQQEREQLQDKYPSLSSYDFETASLSYFRDIVPALLEFQAQYASRALASFVQTSISQKVFTALDRALRRKKIVVIEGREGVGKTEAARAWSRMHCGEARMIDLKGITNQTDFFRKLCKALGLASSYERTMTDMKSQVEDVLLETKPLLIVDEAHQLLPAGERVYAQPQLANWIYTMTNSGVPIALLTTALFAQRVHRIQQQIIWNWGQVDRRMDWVALPDKPTAEDLSAIAQRQLDGTSKAGIKLIVGLAGVARHQLTALIDLVTDARELAEADGSKVVEFEHIENASRMYRLPSEQAKTDAFNRVTKLKRGRPLKGTARPLQTARTDDLPDDESGDISRNTETHAGRKVGDLLEV